jgi:hypothetical protein
MLLLQVKGARYMKLTRCFDHVLERREYVLKYVCTTFTSARIYVHKVHEKTSSITSDVELDPQRLRIV